MATYYDIKRLALILAVQAEIEGMKSENEDRKRNGYSMAYNEQAFSDKSMELQNLAYKHEEEL